MWNPDLLLDDVEDDTRSFVEIELRDGRTRVYPFMTQRGASLFVHECETDARMNVRHARLVDRPATRVEVSQ